MIFEGGVLGGARRFRGYLYLRSTTVLFDSTDTIQFKMSINTRVNTYTGSSHDRFSKFHCKWKVATSFNVLSGGTFMLD